MITINRANSIDPDFIELVKHLDAELKIRDGDVHDFYDQFNKIDAIKYILVAYKNGIPVGCGAIKEFQKEIVEIKRMFVSSEARGNGIAFKILNELENWAKELGYTKCVLETGINQPEAIGLYQKSGYCRCENYGQYKNVSTSFCFEKNIINP